MKYRASHAYTHFIAAWHTAQTVQIETPYKSIGRSIFFVEALQEILIIALFEP